MSAEYDQRKYNKMFLFQIPKEIYRNRATDMYVSYPPLRWTRGSKGQTVGW